jgi:hypothetical protein
LVRRVFLAGGALACAQAVSLWAAEPVQDPAHPAGRGETAQPTVADAGPCHGCFLIPALTPVKLELMAALGSKISKPGDTFEIRLAEPIVVDGRIAVPAGTTGQGEVVHAKKSGGSGAAGELILAARYLDFNGQRLRLRSMNFAQSGQPKVNTVNTIAVASAASPLPIGLLGFLISGGEVVVQQGMIATAKTAEPLALPVGAAAAASTQNPDQQQGETK